MNRDRIFRKNLIILHILYTLHNLKMNQASAKNYRFKSIKTFASDEWMAFAGRKYRTVFDSSELTFVSAEISIYNKLFDEADWECNISFSAYSVAGNEKKLISTLNNKRLVRSDENIALITEGWGSPEKGNYWKQGEYLWEVHIDDEFVGAAAFFIEQAGLPTSTHNPYFDIVSLRFFPGPFDRIPEEQRIYLKKFNREATSYLWMELKIRNKLKVAWHNEIIFNYYDDAGQHKASLISFQTVTENSEGEIYTLSEGWGSQEPGTWKDDQYRLDIIFMDRLLGSAVFQVGDGQIEGTPDFSEKLSGESADKNEKPEAGIKEVMAELNELTGLENVKKKIKEHITYLEFLKLRQSRGFDEKEKISLHSVFTGNPGTGKTTVVKLLGKIYHQMGLLSKGHLVEADRSMLVGEYIGQTAPKTTKAIENARGGILFIDEAYMLARKGDDEKDFGREVMEILLKEMSDGPGDIAVMVAGYPAEMDHFIHSNPGIKSRFMHYFHFDDYLPEELFSIAESVCRKKNIVFSAGAAQLFKKIMSEAYRNRDRSFGNARYVTALVNEAKTNMGMRLMAEINKEQLNDLQISTIEPQDVEQIIHAQMKRKLELAVDEELLSASLMELQALTGLDNIRQEVNELVKLVKYYHETGRDVMNSFTLHAVFTGNPGTGKTTVARIMSKIYKALGLLEKGHLTEADRSSLVAEHVGQTAIKTKQVIDNAKGGVLFIDEAYALAEGGASDFGREAIEILLKNMEDLRGELAVIVAGYPDNMKHFLESNPGLSSRFKSSMHFNDFSPDELMSIAIGMLEKENLKPDDKAAVILKKHLLHLTAAKDKFFGNARTVRNIIEKAVRNQHLRMASVPAEKRNAEMMMQLCGEDISELIVKEPSTGSGIGFKLTKPAES